MRPGPITSILIAVMLTGCSGGVDGDGEPADDAAGSASPGAASSGASASASPTPTGASESSTPSVLDTPSPATSSPDTTRRRRPADPRWVFFTSDRKRYASDWFPGRHRIMIGFGCTEAPYYSPDASCPDGQGFHHGADVAIPCGTPLLAGRPATVLSHDALGSAYGENPVLLRVDGMDVVIGHTRKVYVEVGDRIAPGQRFARVSDSRAPDGCHLHFEVRHPGGGVSDAVAPGPLLGLPISPGTR